MMHAWTMEELYPGRRRKRYRISVEGGPERCPWCGESVAPYTTPKQWRWRCFKDCGWSRKMGRDELVSVEEEDI